MKNGKEASREREEGEGAEICRTFKSRKREGEQHIYIGFFWRAKYRCPRGRAGPVGFRGKGNRSVLTTQLVVLTIYVSFSDLRFRTASQYVL